MCLWYNSDMNTTSSKGFTLIEILVVIGIIAILASVTIVALNPARQFAQARNTQRMSNVNTILNAIGQRMADGRGSWNKVGTSTYDALCEALPLSSDADGASISYDAAKSDANLFDIYRCIIPTYVSVMVVDPDKPTATETNYDTGYRIKTSSTGAVTISAPRAELGEVISVSR